VACLCGSFVCLSIGEGEGEAGEAGEGDGPVKTAPAPTTPPSAEFVVPVDMAVCTSMDSAENLVNVKAVAKAANVEDMVDFANSPPGVCSPATRRQRRTEGTFDVTLVFQEGVSATEARTLVVAANQDIAAGDFKVPVVAGGVTTTVTVTAAAQADDGGPRTTTVMAASTSTASAGVACFTAAYRQARERATK